MMFDSVQTVDNFNKLHVLNYKRIKKANPQDGEEFCGLLTQYVFNFLEIQYENFSNKLPILDLPNTDLSLNATSKKASNGGN